MTVSRIKFIWIDGNFVPLNEAKTHVLDHSLHYGSGVFEGIRGYKTDNGLAIFRVDDHIDRLFKSASALKIKIPFAKMQLKEAIIELIRKNDLRSDFYVRPLVWLGEGDLRILPIDNVTRVMIAVFERGKYYGSNNGIRVKISPITKPDSKSFPSGVKITGTYVFSMLAQMDAKNSGFDDAIVLDSNDNIIEGTAGNIFMVKNGKLFTPPLNTGIIPGITRDSIIEMSDDFDLQIDEVSIPSKQIYQMEEVFMSGTALEITSVVEVNDRKIADGKPGEIAGKIRKEYTDVVHGKNEKYRKWLTIV